ncbi:MAG: DNA photolyase family protein [Nitrosopumilus sp.]|nr:DNA photolyase family protein [Nitrosopumilus sp.]
MNKYKKSLFIFRRDLRLEDNTGLILALQKSEKVIPCFIYDTTLAKKFSKSSFRWNFLNQSLIDLDLELRKNKTALQVFQGIPSGIVQKIIFNEEVDAIFVNADFSNYSKKRDKEISEICKKNNVDFNSHLDFVLHNPNEIKTNDGKPYTIYSHFFKKARQSPVRKIIKNSKNNYKMNTVSDKIIQKVEIENYLIPGGRKNGLKILYNLEKFKNYDKDRNYPGSDSTTKLSAHNKFGTISIREVFHAIQDQLGFDHTLMREIYWREFFNYILFHFPESNRRSFKTRFRKIPWSRSQIKFNAWCNGKTGFPIVDAGMKELNNTGFLHNRVRMIVASFLTKDLHIHWKWGERFFSKKLIDYDPAVNAGNWQWTASTGCDAVPYFRIFNPWLQQEKFDANCIYIKKWIPELAGISPKIIHNLWKSFPKDLKYTKPILNHKVESQKAKEIFKLQ